MEKGEVGEQEGTIRVNFQVTCVVRVKVNFCMLVYNFPSMTY